MADSQTRLDELLVQAQDAIQQNNVAEAVRRIHEVTRDDQLTLLNALGRTLHPALLPLHIQPMDPDFYAGRDQLRTYTMDLESALGDARKPDGSASLRTALDLAQALDRETELLRADYVNYPDLARGLAGVRRTTQVIIRVLSDLTTDTQDGSTGR